MCMHVHIQAYPCTHMYIHGSHIFAYRFCQSRDVEVRMQMKMQKQDFAKNDFAKVEMWRSECR